VLAVVLLGVIAVPAVAGATVFFNDVDNQRVVKPRTLLLTGDGTLEVQHVTWSSWGGATAKGSGRAEYHGCTPSCAQARVHHAQVAITLSKIRTCAGKRYYSRVRLTLPSGKLLDKQYLEHSFAPC
jgi:hypothetical protein